MTDHGNLFGAVEFYNKAKEKNVHPVIGCEVLRLSAELYGQIGQDLNG